MLRWAIGAQRANCYNGHTDILKYGRKDKVINRLPLRPIISDRSLAASFILYEHKQRAADWVTCKIIFCCNKWSEVRRTFRCDANYRIQMTWHPEGKVSDLLNGWVSKSARNRETNKDAMHRQTTCKLVVDDVMLLLDLFNLFDLISD